jgi:hypothetical protein
VEIMRHRIMMIEMDNVKGMKCREISDGLTPSFELSRTAALADKCPSHDFRHRPNLSHPADSNYVTPTTATVDNQFLFTYHM